MKPSVTKRGWVPTDAAGTPRERVASASAAATTFYTQGPQRVAYPGQRGLMGEILYGQMELEAPRRSKGRAENAFVCMPQQ